MNEQTSKVDSVSKSDQNPVLKSDQNPKDTVDSWQVRLKAEFSELQDKISKLEKFLTTPEFKPLPLSEQTDLRAQLNVMQNYAQILQRRIARIPVPTQKPKTKPN